MSRTTAIRDGEWWSLDRVICCDCGLAHDIKVRERKGRVEVSFTRNMRSTALTRRQHHYKFKAAAAQAR